GDPAVPLPAGTTTLPVQNPKLAIAKQMSVPHGNSILAQGSVTPPADFGTAPLNPPFPYPVPAPTLGVIDGAPPLQLNGQPLPDHGIPVLNAIPVYQGVPYGASKYGPSTTTNGIESNANINPNIKLVKYINVNKASIKNYVHFKVSAPAPRITNIDFETGHAEVIGYDQEFWLLNPGAANTALLYYQNIKIKMTLASSSSTLTKAIDFDHPTVNVLEPA
ncbi:MAG: hypothetical protein HKN09_07170, partial [Saprospiraceae bacterium]|nr:hypothetical protein [Saprospiraceae bacterium]